jgi:hypothetical protein
MLAVRFSGLPQVLPALIDHLTMLQCLRWPV